jgi:hypothetical protein
MDEKTEARLTELAQLEPGWLDGRGQPVPFRATATATRLIEHLSKPPTIFPLASGGLELSWGQGLFTIEIDENGAREVYAYMKILVRDDND